MKTTIYTIGHSTQSIEEFINILQGFKIELVADIRTIPGSRFNPQFNQTELKRELQQAKTGYIHLKELGGLRHASKTSANTAWKSASFRGFADYMQTEEFHSGIDQLMKLAQENRTVIMCAEAVPWRCHRSLIGDALVVRDFDVINIMGEKTSSAHKITAWAKVEGVTITYPEVET